MFAHISAIVISAVLAALFYFAIADRRTFQPTLLAKIVIGFYLVAAIFNIFIDLHAYFTYTYPEAFPDYRTETLVGGVQMLLVFSLPLVFRKPRWFAFSFYYVLLNLAIYGILGGVFGVIPGQQILVATIKFAVVLWALLQSLSPIDEASVE